MPYDPALGAPAPQMGEGPMGPPKLSYSAARAEDAMGMPLGQTPLQDLLLAADLMKNGMTEQAQQVYQRAMIAIQNNPQGQQVLDAAGAVGGALGDAAGAVGNAAGAVGGAVGDAAGAVGGAVGDAAGAIGDVGQGVYDAASGVVNSPPAQLTGRAVGQLAGRGADVVGDLAGQGASAVGDLAGQGMEAASPAIDAIGGAVGQGMDAAGGMIGQGADAIGGMVGQGMDAAGGMVDQGAAAAAPVLQELIAAGQMAKQGMQEEAAALYDEALKKMGFRDRSMMERAGGIMEDMVPRAMTGKGAAIDAIGSLFK